MKAICLILNMRINMLLGYMIIKLYINIQNIHLMVKFSYTHKTLINLDYCFNLMFLNDFYLY